MAHNFRAATQVKFVAIVTGSYLQLWASSANPMLFQQTLLYAIIPSRKYIPLQHLTIQSCTEVSIQRSFYSKWQPSRLKSYSEVLSEACIVDTSIAVVAA